MTSNQPLKFMPIIHVKNMPDSVRFYEALGAKVVVGSRDGDWVQIRLGESEIGLLAHPPSPGEGEIEIAFAYTNALAELQTTLESNGVAILRGAGDEAFGEQLQILDPDGRKVKINVIETELIS